MFKRGLLFVSLLAAMALVSGACAAGTNKRFTCVDKDGKTHTTYGDVIPPECAAGESATINEKGQVKKHSDKFDPEQQRASKEEAERKKVEDAAIAEQQRQNNTLLSTYANEKEIDDALKRNLDLLNSEIEGNALMVQSEQQTLDGLRKELAGINKAGKKPADSLLRDITASESRLEGKQKALALSELKKEKVTIRFENDKATYRRLKGLSK